MRSRGRRWGRGQPGRFAWEMAFETEVWQVSDKNRPDLLLWFRQWRRRPGRIFWVMDTTGGWYWLT